MKPESTEMIAALLTIAATQNTAPPDAIAQDARIVAEGIVRLYEHISERLEGKSMLDDPAGSRVK